MKVDKIGEILDLAVAARELNLTFIPNFVGEAGLGKSEGVRQWVKEQQKVDPEFGFVDFRLAYYEGPDFVGFPAEKIDEDGLLRMTHALPDMWPTKGKGLMLFEEPNRGNNMVMNCLMQILTDREVGTKYKLPPGWIMASAMNPEGARYDVSSMDTALADRFEMFHIEYDFQAFMNFIEEAKWNPKVIMYLKTGQWVYKGPDAIGADGKYISPRTWSKLNAIEQAGASDHKSKRSLHRTVCQSILGKHEGNQYWKQCWDDAPLLGRDFIVDKSKSLIKLKEQSTAGNSYAGDKLNITIESVIEIYGGWYEGRAQEHDKETIDEPTMVAILETIPSDLAINLIKGCGKKLSKGTRTDTFFKEFVKRNPKCISLLRDNIKVSQSVDK